MMKKRPLYIFLHVPKTGGTTLNGHLAKHLKFDEEYVHVGRWGKDYWLKHDLQEWFDRPQEEKDKAKFIAGHEVYYGIHKHVSNVEPRYILVLRDPLKRYVSGYHFMTSEAVTKGEKPLDIISHYRRIGSDPSGLGHLRKINMTNKFIWRMNRPSWLNCMNKSKFLTAILRKINHFFLFHTPSAISNWFDRVKSKWQYQRAQDLIDKCWFVCDTAELDTYLPQFFKALGVPEHFDKFRVNDEEKNIDDPEFLLDNRKLQKFLIPDEEMKKFEKIFREENAFDFKLYQEAREEKSRFEKNLTKIDASNANHG
jgi:hypothetical protein